MEPHCFAAQQLRDLISSGRIITQGTAETQIQPSSFEPQLTNVCYVLDSEKGVFRPRKDTTVAKALSLLPKLHCVKCDITEGFEIKVGFTYLFPLDTRVLPEKGEYIVSSPKSTFGRLFVNTRLMADYNGTFDEVDAHFAPGKHLQLWLLVQPRAFNVVVYPGLALNQLRFFSGPNCLLTDGEVASVAKEFPLIYAKSADGQFTPQAPLIRQGLLLHLDLQGARTHGVVGFRARRTPVPIDTKKIAFYDVEDFFTPMYADERGRVVVERNEYYLFATKEVLALPESLNAQLPIYSVVGVAGPLHFAGFIDNGWFGDLVLEVAPEESAVMILDDGMPIGRLDYFRTPATDKVYGPAIGSNYRGQIGPKPAKFFKQVNYASL